MKIKIPESNAQNKNISNSNKSLYNQNIFLDSMKNYLNSIQNTLNMSLKRRTKEHYKSYVHRLYAQHHRLETNVAHKISTYEGHFVLQNAHKVRMKKMQKKFPQLSLKNIKKMIN